MKAVRFIVDPIKIQNNTGFVVMISELYITENANQGHTSDCVLLVDVNSPRYSSSGRSPLDIII